jgi:hypothetical protein
MDAGVLRGPLPLAYHPLYRSYEGGALTRAFRGLPERPDDWWSEDWVGSCTCAGNPGPDGRPQGLSVVDLPGTGPVTLKSLSGQWPEEMGRTDVLVKLLSPSRACQQPRVLRASGGSVEVRLLADDVLEFFDATALEVADEIEVADGRFSIAVVVAGDGWAEGEFGRQPLRRGQTFAWPASLALRVRAGREPVRIVRCMGPREAG